MKNHYKILGFEFGKIGDIIILKFLNRSIYSKIGKVFCLFGYFIFNKVGV